MKPADPTLEENMASMDNQLSQASDEIGDDLSFRESVFVNVMGPDNRGRMRCMGIGPSPTQVFGSRYGSGPASHEISNIIRDQVCQELSNQLREEIRSELYGEFEAQMKEQMSEFEARLMQNFLSTVPPKDPVMDGDVQHTAPHVEEQPINASSSTTERACDYNGVELGVKVEIYSLVLPRELVATGTLISSNIRKVVDGEALGNGYYEVRIEKAINPNYALLRPNEQIKTIGDAEQSSVAWPKYLVSFTN